MSINELEERFAEAIKDFKNDIQSAYEEDSKEPATKHDINELARYTEYALDSFSRSIIDYLKSN